MNNKRNKGILSWVSILTIAVILFIWQVVTMLELVPSFMLPSPIKVFEAFVSDFDLLMQHLKTTIVEAFIGLGLGVLIGFIAAVIMHHSTIIYKMFYPIIIITQTIPTVAIAPILVLWFGYELTPKIILIVLVTFFPIVIGLLEGFDSVDKDLMNLMHSMGANKFQIFKHLKFPASLGELFSGLKISVAYAVVGAVISEWLGGFWGLGVYMTRVRKAYAYDKMFAVIILISIISLFLMWLVEIIQKKSMPWVDGGME